MSEDSHTYQVTSDVPVEQVTHQEVSNAIDEKLIAESQTKTAADVEREQLAEEQQPEENAQQKDEFSSKFAALSRREKEIRAREKQMEDKIAEFEARMAQFEQPEEQPVEEPKVNIERLIRENPLEALKEAGYTYEDLTQMVLNDGEMSTNHQMRLIKEQIESDYKTKFEELENRLAEKEKQEEEAKYNDTINSFKSDIQNFIDDSEEFELIQANEAYDLVYDVIEQYYEENQRILETKQAAEEVEQYLEEELKKVLEKSKKLGSWKPEANQQVAQPSRQAPTLSNSLSAKGEPAQADRLLSREESIAQLAKQLKWHD